MSWDAKGRTEIVMHPDILRSGASYRKVGEAPTSKPPAPRRPDSPLRAELRRQRAEERAAAARDEEEQPGGNSNAR